MLSQIRGTPNWAAKTGSENSICTARGATLHCVPESQNCDLETQVETAQTGKRATRSNFRWLDAGPIPGPASFMAHPGAREQPLLQGRRIAWLSSPNTAPAAEAAVKQHSLIDEQAHNNQAGHMEALHGIN